MPYMCHRDTSEQKLFSIPSAVYIELGHLLQTYVSRLEMATDDLQREIVQFTQGFRSLLYAQYSTPIEVLSHLLL